MNKLITAFMLFYFVNVIFGAIMEGGGGIAATQLTQDLSAGGVTMNVRNTTGFLQAGYVRMGDELVRYTNKTTTTFTVAAGGRGWDDTDAVAHNAGAKVYSPESSVINSALGFNVMSTGATTATINIPIFVWSFMFNTVPKLITWDFPHFRTIPELQLLRYLFITISAGFIMYLVRDFVAAFGGVLMRAFVR